MQIVRSSEELARARSALSGSLALVLTARALAVISGRDYVLPEDVKEVAPAVLAHRITVRPELWMSSVTGGSVVGDVLGRVPAPPPIEGRLAAGPAGQ